METVTVDGTGSTWTNSIHVYVGDAGTGTLNILDGANVSDVSGRVGFQANSTARSR